MTKFIKPFTATVFAFLTACSAAYTDEGLSSKLPTTTTPEATEASKNMSKAETSKLYAAFLKTYVSDKDGVHLVAYGDVTAEHHADLKTYISSLEASGAEGLNDNEIKAYWFNVYNAKTIDIILDNYPLKSIRSLGALNRGPWDKKVLNVKGKGEMSLNDVEHGTLRKMYDEPRIHYAVNCASFGCPNLKPSVWTADKLEPDLQAAAEAYINHPRGVRVEGGKVIASKIFDWYKVDFGGNEAGMLEHFRKYAKGDLAAGLEGAKGISKFEYDWNLNE